MMAMSKERSKQLSNMRRKQILDVALRLFDEKGYSNTSILDISQAAGISKGLVYRYFDSKIDILKAYTKAIEQCEAEVRSMPTPTESMRLFAVRLLSDVKETGYQPPLRVFIIGFIRGELDPDMKENIFNNDYGKKFFGPIVKKGQETGEFRDGDPEELGDIFWHYLLGHTAHIMYNRSRPIVTPDIDLMINLLRKN